MQHTIFADKRCFITGATGGIGRQIALKMAQHGCTLMLTSTRIDKLEELGKEIEELNGDRCKVYFNSGDLNKIRDVKRLIGTARKKLCAVDILVHCAGAFIVKPLSESNLEDYESSLNINLRAAFLFSKAFSCEMVKNKWGRIINIGSSSAYTGTKNTSLYCASKHAILGLSRSLHDELKGHNIRVFCISPSGTKTEMGRRIENQDYDTFLDPEEIADYVAYVCSFDGGLVSEEVRLNRLIVQ